MTADLQARRRLGLTATLVREDGREGEVFSLIGPKRYDAPWKDIEAQGYIAPADCVEVRVDLPRDERVAYAMAEDARQVPAVRDVRDQDRRSWSSSSAEHAGEQLLVIGQYIDQLDELGERLQAPVIKGDTSVKERQRLFDAFRDRRGPDPGGVQGRQLLHRPAGSLGGDPGLRLLRLPPGGGAAARTPAAAQGRTAVRRGSTRSWPGTPSTRTSQRSASASWPSRATPTGSWMPRMSAPGS